MGAGSFLLRSYKINILPIKKVLQLFLTKYFSFNEEISKLQGSHYRNESEDSLETGHRSVGIHRARFENHCYRALPDLILQSRHSVFTTQYELNP